MHYLISKSPANQHRVHIVVLVLMIVSAVKSCQPFIDVPSLWMVVDWENQTVNTHQTSRM